MTATVNASVTGPTEADLASFRDAARDFLHVHATSERVRATIDAGTGVDALAWELAAKQLGIQGLLVPEEHGGSDAGLAAAVIAAAELGAALLPGPYLPTLLGSWALAELGGGAFEAELAAVAAGTTRLAVAQPTGRPAERVTCAGSADLLVLVGTGSAGPALTVVDLGGPGVALAPLETLDLTRPAAAVTLDRNVGRTTPLTEGDLTRFADVAAVLVAAEQVALIGTVLDRTVAYCQERTAFGRAVGSFQAVKHQLAELYCLLEQTTSLLDHAVSALGSGAGVDQSLAAVAAACAAGPAAVHATTEALRLLGGIGYTWEHDAHLFVRRAYDSSNLLGGTYRQRARLAALLGLDRAI